MKAMRELITSTIIGGVFVVVPVYLAILLLLKGMKAVGELMRPIAGVLPDWLPAEGLFSLLVLLAFCFLVGAAVRTRTGRRVQERLEVARVAPQLIRGAVERLVVADGSRERAAE